MSNVHLAVYGSLRKGNYNFDRMAALFGEESIKHVKTVKVKVDKNFTLVNVNGYYPALVKMVPGSVINAYANDEITFDIIEVSPEVDEAIEYMEVGAYYKPTTLEIEGTKLKTYISDQDGDSYSYLRDRTIPSGDWETFQQERFKTYGYTQKRAKPDPFEEKEV